MNFTLGTFYKSKTWQKFREQVIMERIERDGEIICEECGKAIIHKYDCIAHHKQFLTDQNVNDFSVSLNPDNIALVHHRCHNKLHDRWQGGNHGGYVRRTKIVYLVWGSPCAGKSTYVDSVMEDGDIIVDIDRIYKAISNTRSDRLFPSVMQIYRSMIDMVKTRNGAWNNAWVVRTLPLSSERERLAKELDAELIFIDTDKETCLERARHRQEGYDQVVLKWWDKFQPDPPPASSYPPREEDCQ